MNKIERAKKKHQELINEYIEFVSLSSELTQTFTAKVLLMNIRWHELVLSLLEEKVEPFNEKEFE